jgi:4-hydroxy-3-methylbut-2-en-1-yl diphosphate reductase
MVIVEIDERSGFCSGVVKAIEKAETFLESGRPLYSLGDIVHNNSEVERLETKGMQIISKDELATMKEVDVLFRAHGEPPVTYEVAARQGIRLIDATCPVVSHLQRNIRKEYEAHKDSGTQLVIFGKSGHAEVIGLNGQTDNTAIVLEHVEDASRLDYSRPVILYSQTTKSLDEFLELIEVIRNQMQPGVEFKFHDTICRQVANRLPHLREFVSNYDTVLFVSGQKSSNGKSLFDACKKVNDRTYFISGSENIEPEMIAGVSKIGICGATSTPLWLMEEVKKEVENMLNVG